MNWPANTGGTGLSPGCNTRRQPVCGIVTMGATGPQDNRDRELEVIAVQTGAGREAFLPVMHARPSRIAK